MYPKSYKHSVHFSVRTKTLDYIKVRKLSILVLKCTFLGKNRLYKRNSFRVPEHKVCVYSTWDVYLCQIRAFRYANRHSDVYFDGTHSEAASFRRAVELSSTNFSPIFFFKNLVFAQREWPYSSIHIKCTKKKQ